MNNPRESLNRRQFLRMAGGAAAMVGAGLTSCAFARENTPAPPNIVFILVDDMGWRDSEAYGSKLYKSPAQMRLKKEGMLFTDAHAAPLCSPTRASILTGQFPARLNLTAAITRGKVPDPKEVTEDHGFRRFTEPQSRDRLPNKMVTFAECLKDAGYQTWFLGKWHLGHMKPVWPIQQGFDVNIGVGGPGPGSYFSPYKTPQFPDGPKGEYIADRLALEANKLLEKRDLDKPFLLYMAHFNVHAPYQARDENVQKYRKQIDPEGHQKNPVMAAMLEGMDKSTEKVLDKLDELGLTENTIVLFVSDNGGVTFVSGAHGDQHPLIDTAPVTSNWPLRGGKASIYEGGTRVPLLVRWPGVVQPGSRCMDPVHVVDFFPTLLDIGQAKKPDGLPLDGISLLPVLKGTGKVPEDRAILCHFPHGRYIANVDQQASSIRVGQWKLIRFYNERDDKGEPVEVLYDLKKDIGETTNVAAENPEVTTRLSQRLNAMLENTEALLPRKNKNYDPEEEKKRIARYSKDSPIALDKATLHWEYDF